MVTKLISMNTISLLLLMVFRVECAVMSSEDQPTEVDFIDMAENFIRSGFQLNTVKNGKFFSRIKCEDVLFR